MSVSLLRLSCQCGEGDCPGDRFGYSDLCRWCLFGPRGNVVRQEVNATAAPATVSGELTSTSHWEIPGRRASSA